MGCSHCMINAGPEGQHMDMNVYDQVLAFIEWTEFPFIMISGGEPCHHPEILTIIKKANDKNLKTVLLSNGMFLEDMILTRKILSLGISIQITNDDRFYPKRVPIVEHPQIVYEDRIRVVSPFGRAVTNKIPMNRQSPLCFNLRSVCRHTRDFKEALRLLRGMQKFCTPSINIDGSISAGESNTCTCIGTVSDINLTLTNNLCSMTCQRCGLINNVKPEIRQAIGE